jgi:amino acid adenylation domain-containing protein
MVLHAALATLLHRLGAGSDIAVGTPVAGRTDDALNGLIGFFVNTLVLRTDLAGDPSFAELLSRVRETDLGAYAHQETPLDRLVEVLNPVRSPDRHPLFQVMLALGTSPADQRWGLELTAKTVPVHTGTEKFDFTVNLTTAEDELTGYVEYATDLFDAETATSFAERLTRILRSAVADPEQPVSRFTILGEAERNRIVHEWNATEAEISPLSLPEMIQRQVRETPDAVAMVYEGITLTYADLNRRANQLARMLRSLGVRPERTVGIHLPRNADQVVGLLAVLKAGGAFVPLDANWPAQRISDIAANAGLTAILSQDDLADTLPTLPIPVVNVDSVDCSAESTENLRISAGADNLAYVIYTSGSTGTPKGAMIPHRAISNRLPWQVDLLGLTPADAVLYKAPLTFDISVNEVFLPLVSGARLVVAAPGGERDTSYLLTLISSQKVTFIYLVSTMLELLLERPDIDEGARSLRHVWCGGEVLTPQLYERFRQHIDATMYHGYGPAETTIGVSCQVYRGQDPAHGITIGHPNPNNQVYVLDEHLNPVPIGVPGQLYIGGVQLARGFLGDPRRTAEAFAPDPFSGRRGARLYATGDLGRLKRDGAIEFLGRADNQVKIRGMRLELEEIDAVLARHPKIRQAVVLARKDASGTPSLSAYCIPEKDVTAEELRQWLSTQLPDYMVPAEYTMLAAFPLMVSGKVDRKALEAIQPAATQHSTVDDWIPPQPGMQRVVADIWSTVLGAPRIGARDNFFDLGGHSLLLTRAQTALQRELGHGIPIVDLFTHATVETLAAYLEGERTSIGHALDVLLPLRPEGIRPAVFCVHPASGLAWPFAGMRQHIAPEYPLYGIQARGLHGEPGAAATSVDEMAGEYVRQIRSVQPEGPYRLLGWSFGGVVAHAMATLLQSAGQRVDLLGMLDSYPAYPWDKLASDHEQQALRSLLYMSHYDLNTLPEGPLDRRTVLGIVAEQGGVLSELDEATITAVMETFVRSAPLQQQAKHAVFQGDLLFFTATVNQIDSALSHKDWLPHVRGKIENIDIACEHKDMLQAGPTAIIGKAINARLRRLE